MSDSSTTPATQRIPTTPSEPRPQPVRGARYRLWRLWLLIAVPVSYPVFVLGSLIMLSMIPISMLLHRTPAARTRWLRRVLHLGARLWVKFTEVVQILVLNIDDQRTELKAAAANSATPVLVIANHPSLIDVLLVSAALPNLCCVLKGALHYNPLFTLLIRHLDYLPNADPERMLAEGSKRLQAGEQLLIFPEGTRSVPGQALEFRFGAAELALRSGACALPVTLHSNSRYLSKGMPWYRFPPEKLHYQLELGPLLPADSDLPLTTRSDRRRARRALNERWRTHFEQRLTALGVGN